MQQKIHCFFGNSAVNLVDSGRCVVPVGTLLLI